MENQKENEDVRKEDISKQIENIMDSIFGGKFKEAKDLRERYERYEENKEQKIKEICKTIIEKNESFPFMLMIINPNGIDYFGDIEPQKALKYLTGIISKQNYQMSKEEKIMKDSL